MLTEIQEKWLKALESGEYKQCTEALFDGTGYCCLGVADVVCLGRTFTRSTDHSCFFDNNGNTRVLDSVGAEMLGIETTSGWITEVLQEEFYEAIRAAGYLGQYKSSLAAYNDDGATFAQIAAAIRKVPGAVFTNAE
jgi:hypothetical protein